MRIYSISAVDPVVCGGMTWVSHASTRRHARSAERNEDGLFLKQQAPRLRSLGAGCRIGNRSPFLRPLNRPLVDRIAPESSFKLSKLFFYYSTYCLSRCGAAVRNMSYSAFLHAFNVAFAVGNRHRSLQLSCVSADEGTCSLVIPSRRGQFQTTSAKRDALHMDCLPL
jgi:hypothetical protein